MLRALPIVVVAVAPLLGGCKVEPQEGGESAVADTAEAPNEHRPAVPSSGEGGAELLTATWLDLQGAETEKAAGSKLRLELENRSQETLFVTVVATYDKGTTKVHEIDISPTEGTLEAGASKILELDPAKDLTIDFASLPYSASVMVKASAWSEEKTDHPITTAMSPPLYLHPADIDSPMLGYMALGHEVLSSKWAGGDFRKQEQPNHETPGLLDEEPEAVFDVAPSRVVAWESE